MFQRVLAMTKWCTPGKHYARTCHRITNTHPPQYHCDKHRPHHAQTTTTSSSSLQQQHKPLEIFTHDDHDSNRMTPEQRRGIAILHQDGNSIDDICIKVGCSRPTAYHWMNHYRATGKFDDDLREGRKRKLDELQVDEIVDAATRQPFTTPKGNVCVCVCVCVCESHVNFFHPRT